VVYWDELVRLPTRTSCHHHQRWVYYADARDVGLKHKRIANAYGRRRARVRPTPPCGDGPDGDQELRAAADDKRVDAIVFA
jgi:hypothetical protein